MSSLKDWYRYVDSKARTRPEDAVNAEGDGAAGERDAGRPPAGESTADGNAPGSAGLTESQAEEIRAAVGLGAGEEALDVWSGLFPQPRKPEPKPATAPLRRPTARLDEIPPGLSFAQPPDEGPPPPQFELPEAEAEIPRFDDFVSPFTADPAPVAATPPSVGTPSSPVTEPPSEGTFQPTGPPGEPAILSTVSAEPSLSAERLMSGGESAGPVPSDTEGAPTVLQTEDTTVAAAPAEPLAAPGIWDGEDVEGETGQVRWRSPFRLPGPGRTVSSGAPSPKPEPVVPRSLASAAPDEEPAWEEAMTADPVPPRPAPGTEAWERERVERLARTFRETLRALEDSLGAPRTPVASPPPEETPVEIPPARTESPAPISDHEPVERAADRLSGAEPTSPIADLAPALSPAETPERTIVLPPPAAPFPAVPVADTRPVEQAVEAAAVPVEEPPAAPAAVAALIELPTPATIEPEGQREEAPRAEAAAGAAEAALRDGTPPAAIERFQEEPEVETAFAVSVPSEVPPSPRVSSATPDVLRNIEEAALIRQRLPQHMAMLLRIPTNEVAQNSYKSPFRETREDLIGRLLDPQLTLEEAARILGVCPTTVRRYTNRGMLQCHRTPGNQRRFRMSDVLQFLEQYGDRIDRAAEVKQVEAVA